MRTWIALFRGLNVGGNNVLPMAELKVALQSLKLQDVRTYIQSGNVVFRSPSRSAGKLRTAISDSIDARNGFRPHVLLFSPQQLQRAVTANPFTADEATANTIHFFFLEQPATSPDTAKLDSLKVGNENYSLTDEVLYLHAPDGIARSKLARSVEKLLNVAVTARNQRTVIRVLQLAASEM